MKYPIGIQSFEDMRRKGYVYVDKTAWIYQLASTGKYYFLSRPRRFGKSLLLSTMEAYFQGKKELFRGLALERLETEWTEYPILHLDLNTSDYKTPQALCDVLDDTLSKWEKIYGTSATERSLSLRFKGIVERAYEKTGRQVVILIDEYDKPMLQAIGDEKLQDEYRSELKAFYSVLKTQDRYIKFAFLTGVTKFGKVSVFSDLNNLKDISMDGRYVEICGITEKEMHEYFEESIKELGEANNMSYEETCDKLREQYDGYHFCEDSIGVYNPFSLLGALDSLKFKDYWFETGTPTFLVELMKRTDYDLHGLQTSEVTTDVLNSIDAMDRNPLPVIYQSGYLTIKDYDKEFQTYTLRFPNKEVEQGFMRFLMPYYTPASTSQSPMFISNFVRDIRRGDARSFLQRLQTLFDAGDYRIAGKAEKYFQNAMFIVLRLLGFYVEVEYPTANSRMDAVIKTNDYIYIIECKLDKSADEALQQIEDKGYAAPFAMDSRKLYKIGISFSSETRGVAQWRVAGPSLPPSSRSVSSRK